MFVRRGLVEIPEGGREGGRGEEALLEDALEAGAEDVEEGEEEEEEGEEGEEEPRVTRVYCEPAALAGVRKGLEERGWAPSLVQFSYVPTTWVEVEVEEEEGKEKGKVPVLTPGQQLLTLLDALEEDPDVQNVFHNARLI